MKIYKINILRNSFIIGLLFFCSHNLLAFQKDVSPLEQLYPIIPQPQSIEYFKGKLDLKSIFITSDVFSNEALLLEEFLTEKGVVVHPEGTRITLVKKQLSFTDNSEAYQLNIGKTITITASTSKGAFYAVQSLKQLYRKNKNNSFFPYVHIEDAPVFKIRGFMHDTGRNFQPIELLKEQIELLSFYKFNVFHWHLTDNPGWRLESKLYPQLQSKEATSRMPGYYYTQEDFREIVDFCKARHMTVIPELDIPGHTEAFRKAFNNASMTDPGIQQVLIDLIEELAGLANASEMPYIHLGTDEVRKKEEQVPEEYLIPLFNKVREHGREVIVWNKGITVAQDSTSINQLWASYKNREGHRFIESRGNYINHLDPFTAATALFHQQPCEVPKGNEIALGGILCSWPDNRIDDPRNVLKQNPIYPAIVFYSDAIWNGKNENKKEYWANLPLQNSADLNSFKKFENKVLTHRDLFFKDKEFPYIKQSDVKWSIIGPFINPDPMTASFEVEKELKNTYQINDSLYSWTKGHTGATIHFKHFFGFPALTKEPSGIYYAYTTIYSPDHRIQDFWIGFQGWSRSSRRGGPLPMIGQWHTTDPKIWVNDELIEPPVWKQPGLGSNTDEIPFVDEDYFYREPTKVKLHKGWNKILIKVPFTKDHFKWMFTCIPVNIDGVNISEVKELIFNPLIEKK